MVAYCASAKLTDVVDRELGVRSCLRIHLRDSGLAIGQGNFEPVEADLVETL